MINIIEALLKKIADFECNTGKPANYLYLGNNIFYSLINDKDVIHFEQEDKDILKFMGIEIIRLKTKHDHIGLGI